MSTSSGLLGQLTALLKAHRRLPRYRSVRLPVRSIEDWQVLPMVSRRDLRSFPIGSCPETPFYIAATSGSSETRLLVYHSRGCYEAHLRRQMEIYSSVGLKRGDRCLNLCSYSMSGGGRMMEAAFRGLGLAVIPYGEVSTASRLNEACDLIRRMKPNVINSYVNQTYDVLSHLGKGHAIERCIVNGEVLPSSFKNSMERISGVSIYDNYGSMEFSGFAISQSPRDEYLKVFDRGLFIEVVGADGRASLTGRGRIVVTDLLNYSMPFLRYMLGDEVELIRQGGDVFIKIFGRADDHVLIHGEVESRRHLEEAALEILGHPHFFFLLSKQRPDLKDRIDLHVLKGRSRSLRLEQDLKGRFPFLSGIRWISSEVPRTATGKFRHFLDQR